MKFDGAAKPLTRDDVRTAANMLDVPEHVIWALRKVESAGKAFKNGRPVIAWEPHIFYRELPEAKRAQAVAADLAHPKWGVLPYLSTQSGRYDQLSRAMRIDKRAALKSASWGAYQQMGFNFERSGFRTVAEFIDAIKTSEGEQLRAIARFIKSDSAMHGALRAGDWQEFARRYNGSGYAKNRYAQKLERWASHYKGKRLASEVERTEKHPKDVADARKEVKDAVKHTVGLGTYLAMAWAMIGDAREAIDTAINDLTGLKSMAPWIGDAIMVLASISAVLAILGIVRSIMKSRENADVAA